MVGLGLFLTKIVFDGSSGWDVEVNRWFAHRRATTWNDLSRYGSQVADTFTVIAVAAIVVFVLGLRRCWREIGFLAIALFLEVTVFLTTTLLVDRARPPVVRLDDAPPTSSFPSGHTAAAVVLYVGLALIITAHVRNPIVRALAWIVAILAPLFVATSRLYRGMHFPSDVASGALLGRRVHRRCLVRGAHRGRRRSPPGGIHMTSVAVLAHAGKSLGGGLGELREVLAREGVADPLWYEVPKSKKAPKQAAPRRRSGRGPRLRLGWRRHGAALRRRAGRHQGDRGDHPGRDREPPRVEPRDPEGHRRGGRASACTAPTASSTSA